MNPLLNLFPYIIYIIEISFEHLEVLMEIIEKYLLLFQENFLKVNESFFYYFFNI